MTTAVSTRGYRMTSVRCWKMRFQNISVQGMYIKCSNCWGNSLFSKILYKFRSYKAGKWGSNFCCELYLAMTGVKVSCNWSENSFQLLSKAEVCGPQKDC
ncbi:hypothetical protein TNCT_205131 [Trichonephila clavata]|uniref:Uncharacterized protein n=1 Tax=Trichonephila clavata TaxID=2740835 RepID=A0A8X6FGH0_TRICU|nr:hypothetical protein TNCT_205131 [Trichonephila clavata]